jgi:nucleoside-diphosphate-sugar epimerase
MFKSNYKILITGGLGYIGNHLIFKLLHEGFSVVVNDIVDQNLWGDKIQYIRDDVCYLSCPDDVDFVVHLAAEVGYKSCEDEKKAIHTNIDGTKRVASFNKPTLFFSSGSIYGKLDEICTEKSTTKPETLYSKTKKEGEEIIIKNLSSFCIVRPATAFGVSLKMRDDLLIHDLCKKAVFDKSFDLYQPSAMRTFYFVEKVAEFISFSLNNWDLFNGEIFNLGHQTGNISKKGVVDIISSFVDFEIIDNLTQIDLDQRDYEVDYSKLNKLWDNSMNDLNLYVRKIVNYYKGLS